MKKKWWIGLPLAAILIVLSWLLLGMPVVVLSAQSLPLTRTLAWDAPVVDATHTAADSYIVRLDGTTIGTPTTTTQSVTFQTAGAHTLTVQSVNTWGAGGTATLNVLVLVPAAPGNLRIN